MPRHHSASALMSSLLVLCGLLFVASGATADQSADPSKAGVHEDQDGGVAAFQARPHSAEGAGAARTLLQADKCKRCEFCKCDNNCNCLRTTDGRAVKVERLLHSNTKKCLDIPGNWQLQGQRLQEWDCNGSKAQTFVLIQADHPKERLDPIHYYIRSSEGLCLDVSEHSKTRGVSVNLWKCTSKSNQAFEFRVIGGAGGWMTIRPLHAPDMCLQVANANLPGGVDGRLHIWPCNESRPQAFYASAV